MEKHVIAEIMHHLYWPMGAEIIELGGVVGTALCIWHEYYTSCAKNQRPKTSNKYPKGYISKKIYLFYTGALAGDRLSTGISIYVHASTSILKMVHVQKAIYEIITSRPMDPSLRQHMTCSYRRAPSADEIVTFLTNVVASIITAQYTATEYKH